MILILDAYNVIYKIPFLEKELDKNLRSARDALTDLCQKTLHSRGDIEQIILVFDGNSTFRDLPQVHYPKMKLVFSDSGEDADDRIVLILEDLAHKAQKFVVSDDNFVRNSARAHKAKGMDVKEFRQLVSKRSPSKGVREAESTLSQKDAEDITTAYKRDLGLL